ncbi:MAG: flagellar basal body L-ring protein FlgH [Gemmatimonadaceae bacterium]|nr:flagellar basal body L-ring protein FlgH [Gemmatimonadaceae bacterium]
MITRAFLLGGAALLLAAPLAAQDEADSAAAPAPVRTRQSFISDRRAFVAGDVITVMVDEFTLASANLGNSNINNTRGQKDASLSLRMPGSTTSGSVGFSSTNNGEQTQRGEATRQNRFQSEMTVRVVEILPNGVLRVEGKKLLDIDKNKQEVVMSGFIRPQDIGAFNQVESARVGELRLEYKLAGQLGKPKQGIVSKVLGMLWP